MSVRKPQNKDLKGHNKKIRKKSEEDLENDDDSLSENELVDEEFPEQKITDDPNSDEFDEYDHIVEKFEKGNTKRKIVNIFNIIIISDRIIIIIIYFYFKRMFLSSHKSIFKDFPVITLYIVCA